MKSITKKVLIFTLAIVTALSFTGCGKKDDSSSEKSAKKLIVATEPTFPPFDTTNKDGELDGFDMDLMKAIAKDQNLDIEFKSFEFDALIPALKAGNADIVAAGMNSNDGERKKQVDFSKTYCDAGLVVMVKKDSKIKSIKDFKSNMKVASQTGTSGGKLIEKLKKQGKIADAVSMKKFDACVLQLINGDVEAVIIDKLVGEAYLAKKPGKTKIVGKTMNAEAYAFAVKKGNKDLLEKLNKGLEAIKKSGEFDKLKKKWF